MEHAGEEAATEAQTTVVTTQEPARERREVTINQVHRAQALAPTRTTLAHNKIGRLVEVLAEETKMSELNKAMLPALLTTLLTLM